MKIAGADIEIDGIIRKGISAVIIFDETVSVADVNRFFVCICADAFFRFPVGIQRSRDFHQLIHAVRVPDKYISVCVYGSESVFFLVHKGSRYIKIVLESFIKA